MNNALKFSFFILILIGIVISRIALASPDNNDPHNCDNDPNKKDKVSIASGRSKITKGNFESSNYKLVDDIVDVCPNLACNIGSESGLENLEKIIRGEADAGIVPIDVASIHEYTTGMNTIIPLISLNLQTMHIIVMEDKNINTFRDLSRLKAKVGLWGSSKSSFKNVIKILKLDSIETKDYSKNNGINDGAEVLQFLKSGYIQAYVIMGAQPYNLIQNINNVKLIGLSAIDIQSLTYNGYHPIKINNLHYQNQGVTDKTNSISSRNTLFALNDPAKSNKLNELKECIKSNIKELQSNKHHPTWRNSEIDITSIPEWPPVSNSQ